MIVPRRMRLKMVPATEPPAVPIAMSSASGLQVVPFFDHNPFHGGEILPLFGHIRSGRVNIENAHPRRENAWLSTSTELNTRFIDAPPRNMEISLDGIHAGYRAVYFCARREE